MTDVGGVPFVSGGSGYGGGDGFGGLIALFAIFALFGGRGFGFGGEGGAGGLSNDMLYQTLNTNTQAGFSNLQNDMGFDSLVQGQANIQRDILMQTDTLTTALANGFGNLNNNVTSVGYQVLGGQKDIINVMEKNTCAIITNQNALAKEAELRAASMRISELERLASEQRITATILETLQPPRPVPAYASANPYEQYIAPVRVVGGGFNGFNNCAGGLA